MHVLVWGQCRVISITNTENKEGFLYNSEGFEQSFIQIIVSDIEMEQS